MLMRLNMDCFRDVLIKIEELQQFTISSDGLVEVFSLDLTDLEKSLPNYSKEDIVHSLLNLKECGYIRLSYEIINREFCSIDIPGVTFSGHQFADKIRDNARWGKIKFGINAIRDYSLSAIESIAEGITSAAIASYLSHNP